MTDEIDSLEKKIKMLTSELNQKKKEHDKALEDYYKIKYVVDDLRSEIDKIKKQRQMETFKKMTAGGEVVSFRQLFKEIRSGRDFSKKTLIWCSKDGKSGFFVNIWVNNENAHKILLEKYHNDMVYDPLILMKLMNEFPLWDIDVFNFKTCTVGSMVDGHRHSYKELDDIYISIHDTKTLSDFTDLNDLKRAKGLRFFKPGSLPYIEKCLGELDKDGLIVLRGCYLSPEHAKNYVLYPAKAGSEGVWRH